MKRLLLAALFVAGCGEKDQVETSVVADAKSEPPPPIACTEGAMLMGKAPPAGFEMHCKQMDPNRPGTWLKQGPAITWHPDGTRASLGQYDRDKKHGYWQSWFPDGQPESQGSYANDVMTGLWTTYHTTGSKKSEGEYTSGKQDGHWSFWHPNGQLKTEGEMSEGLYMGNWLEYDETGRPTSEREYRDGRLVRQRQL